MTLASFYNMLFQAREKRVWSRCCLYPNLHKAYVKQLFDMISDYARVVSISLGTQSHSFGFSPWVKQTQADPNFGIKNPTSFGYKNTKKRH